MKKCCNFYAARVNGRDGCLALHVRSCPEDCAFYKSERQAIIDRNNAAKRINTLPKLERLAIGQKYYNVKKNGSLYNQRYRWTEDSFVMLVEDYE